MIQRRKKNLPRSKIDIREKNSGNTTSLSFRAGGREKISSEKVLVVNDFARLVLD